MATGREKIRRKPSIYSAVTYADQLMDYTIRITANHNNFPKHYRYTLTDRLVFAVGNVAANLRLAAQIRPNNAKSLKLIRKKLTKANSHLALYESLMVTATHWGRPKNLTYWVRIFALVQTSILSWLSAVAHKERKMVSNKKKRKKLKQIEREVQKQLSIENCVCRVNPNDGFITMAPYTGSFDNPEELCRTIYTTPTSDKFDDLNV